MLNNRVSRLLTLFLFAGAGLLWASAAGATSTIATPTYGNVSNFNAMFERSAISFGGFSGLLSVVAYILGVLLLISGLLKIKEHVEQPQQVTLRDPAIRIIIAGALFALPSIMTILTQTFGGQTGTVSASAVIASTASGLGAISCAVAGGGGGLGGALFNGLTGGTLSGMICNAASSFEGLTGLLNVILYLSAITLLIWALVQLKDHIVDPRSMALPVPLKKMAVAGIFFAFPAFITVVANTFSGSGRLLGTDVFSTLSSVLGMIGTILNGGTVTLPGSCGSSVGSIIGSLIPGNSAPAVGGLDCMFMRLIGDISGPLQAGTSLFCYLAGIILIIFAVRRIMESTDKGARGPLGTGTFAMLAIGGILLSFNTFLATITGSMFPSIVGALGNVMGTGFSGTIQQTASLSYTSGLTSSGVQSINSVLSSVLAFAFLIGMFSVLRGLFILREVADGGNASIMAGATHIIGGGMAINMGPLITAVQNTLGLSSVGLTFS